MCDLLCSWILSNSDTVHSVLYSLSDSDSVDTILKLRGVPKAFDTIVAIKIGF